MEETIPDEEDAVGVGPCRLPCRLRNARVRAGENLRSVISVWQIECTVPIDIFEISNGRPVSFVTMPNKDLRPSFSWSAAFSVKVERNISSGFTS